MVLTPRAIAATALAVVAVLVLIATRGGDDPYIVKAIYEDAGGLTENYDVKVDGIPAGSVSRVELDDQDRAVLTLEIDEGAAPIGAGARADARPVNLLGEKYVDLDLGDRSRPQPSGTVIPPERTGAPVELDDVLNTLDASTRARLRILINETGVALTGRGADFNGLLRVMPKALDETREVIDEVNEQTARIRSAISAGDRVIAQVHDHRGDLNRLVKSAGDALGTVAEKRAELGQTLTAAPGALRSMTATLRELETTAGQLGPVSRSLRRTATPLTETLAALPGFAKDTTSTLEKAVDVAPALAKLGREATPDVKRVTKTTGELSTFLDDLAPVMRGLQRGVMRDAIGLMDGWSELIQRSDGLGHISRVRAHIDQEVLTSSMSRLLGDAPALPGAKKKQRSTAEAPTAPPSAAAPEPAAPAPAPAPKLPVVGDVLEDLQDTVDDVVGPLGKGLKDLTTPLAPGGKLLPGGAPRAGGDQDMQRLLDYLLGS